ncbi:hypothetical protein EYZ11_006926 [Aspergillus tanneri]|uniref:Uncharacterized protein n=1 Tax=Aspergillus tanneri TaxID=1220188 RepID=A0A4S3JE69_9EURO|nr:hypothetical protein EYZ11_006926 [Aspergillus tanneri]
MPLTQEDLSQSFGNTVSRIRDILSQRRVTIGEEKPGEAWLYGGKELEKEIKELKDEIKKKGHIVLQCNVFHFVRSAQIVQNTQNPKPTYYLLIPVNGTPTYRPGERLLPGKAYYTDELPLLSCENWDIIMAALSKGNLT